MNKASNEWFTQRSTAFFVAIIALTAIFLSGIILLCKKCFGIDYIMEIRQGISGILFGRPQDYSILEAFSSPIYAVLAIFLVYAAMLHGAIGMKIILEDYVQNKMLRTIFTRLCFFFANFVTAVTALTIITIHIKYNIFLGV
jgi:succinate dehydrogenase hydrophobic membrane anchor protein